MAFDPMEAIRRAQEAQERASEQLRASLAAVQKQQEEMEAAAKEKAQPKQAPDTAAQQNEERQVELMGHLLGPEGLQLAAATEVQIQEEVERQVAAYAAMSADDMLSKLLGDDMGVIAAALETLADEDGDPEEDEDEEDDEAVSSEAMYNLLEAEMARVDALPEPAPIHYGSSDERWDPFGILLSGIISQLNQHELDGLEVEERIPVFVQQVATVVRRSWGLEGREDLLETLRYLTQEGHRLRYRTYAAAASPEELYEDGMDEDDLESIRSGWAFAQHFKERYPAAFLLGWDMGRAAMLTRWGFYLGWITRGEAVGILSDLAQAAAGSFRSWRAFGRSYQFGGVFWKQLCGDNDAGYLRSLTKAITSLLTDTVEEWDGGQWRQLPWPAGPRQAE